MKTDSLILVSGVNMKDMYGIGKEAVVTICGEDGAVDPIPSMGGEDFSIYTEKTKGCFYWLGVGNKKKTVYINGIIQDLMQTKVR